MQKEFVDSPRLRKEAKKIEVAFPRIRLYSIVHSLLDKATLPVSGPYRSEYNAVHPLLDEDSLPAIRPNSLLVATSNSYGERESGIYVHEVERPRIWATILAVPRGFCPLYWGPDKESEGTHLPFLQPGNTICFTRFRESSIGTLKDKEGRSFNAEIVSAADIECYFDQSLIQWKHEQRVTA